MLTEMKQYFLHLFFCCSIVVFFSTFISSLWICETWFSFWVFLSTSAGIDLIGKHRYKYAMKWLKRAIISGQSRNEPDSIPAETIGQKQHRHLGLFWRNRHWNWCHCWRGNTGIGGDSFCCYRPWSMAGVPAKWDYRYNHRSELRGTVHGLSDVRRDVFISKRVLSVGAVFSMVWVVWFASIVAAALYVFGFTTILLNGCASLLRNAPVWLCSVSSITLFSLIFTILCTFLLGRSVKAGENWVNVLKALVFTLLIADGVWAW